MNTRDEFASNINGVGQILHNYAHESVTVDAKDLATRMMTTVLVDQRRRVADKAFIALAKVLELIEEPTCPPEYDMAQDIVLTIKEALE